MSLARQTSTPPTAVVSVLTALKSATMKWSAWMPVTSVTVRMVQPGVRPSWPRLVLKRTFVRARDDLLGAVLLRGRAVRDVDDQVARDAQRGRVRTVLGDVQQDRGVRVPDAALVAVALVARAGALVRADQQDVDGLVLAEAAGARAVVVVGGDVAVEVLDVEVRRRRDRRPARTPSRRRSTAVPSCLATSSSYAAGARAARQRLLGRCPGACAAAARRCRGPRGRSARPRGAPRRSGERARTCGDREHPTAVRKGSVAVRIHRCSG